MEKRVLGRSGIEVSAMGLGCWAIGGKFFMGNLADGWGDVDDRESVQAILRAMELGVNFIDTADAYGVGHSEEIIGKAITGKRNQVVIATKFGHFGNESISSSARRRPFSPDSAITGRNPSRLKL
jgi:aryl-alcohol dehydrogenase-like predicted oxidoreductase